MLSLLIPEVLRRLHTVREAPNLSANQLEAAFWRALDPPPGCTLRVCLPPPPEMLMAPYVTLPLDCQIMFGSPLILSGSPHLQGITYQAHQVLAPQDEGAPSAAGPSGPEATPEPPPPPSPDEPKKDKQKKKKS